MPQNVLYPLISVADAARARSLRVSELASHGDLAFVLRFVREQAGSHLAGIDEHERSIKEACN